MKSILITGCNRGLGLGLVNTILKQEFPPQKLIATCRNPDNAKELRDLANTHKNLFILQLDVTKTDTFADFASNVGKIVSEDGLNLLFNNAGYAPKSTRINYVTTEQMLEAYAINTVGPLMLTKSLLSLLKKASEANKNQNMGSSRAAVVNMTSWLGSIAQTDGGLYPYRCSKAALNMATRTMSIDLKSYGILVTCLHPGWVKTDMGGSKAPMDVDESVDGIVNMLNNLTDKHNGEFYRWDGKPIEW